MLVALYFTTDRFPFVVKGEKDRNHELEVPWREGTRVRAAKRSELIRLLYPLVALPDIEILNGSISIHEQIAPNESHFQLYVHLEIYLIPRTRDITVIPLHKCQVIFDWPGEKQLVEQKDFSINPKFRRERRSGRISPLEGRYEPDSLTIEGTSTELVISGPGACKVSTSYELKDRPREIPDSIQFELILFPAYSVHSVIADVEMIKMDKPEGQPLIAEWQVKK